MNCPSCGVENQADHKHCWSCGAKLEVRCPGCGKPNPVGHRFCSDCGEQLSLGDPVERTTPKEERRFITALFMDLVGFTPLSEASDPEEIRSLLTTYFERSKVVIERFGGVVDKFTGDAVTAFWGAVTATENDAEVAVRAGLELIDSVTALGSELEMPGLAARVGILSGEAAVGPGGNEKGLVVGDIVNTAARLQAVAEPGTVVVGESTQRLAARAISFESLGSRELKGKSAPVAVWRAVRLIAELGGRRRQDALEGPFIGRQEELRLLKDQLAAVGREKRGRLISVVGEAGIGKSRLLWEFEKYLDGLAEDTYWHTGRSPSYGDGLTFWALGEMIRRRAGIAENDDDASTRSRLKAT
ncbi:MAG TPA: adenylate/guanylate cyclase domain-containing protein, partial [Acidimicrobiia bacterium]